MEDGEAWRINVAVGRGGIGVAVGVEVVLKMKGVDSSGTIGLGVLEGVGDGCSVGVCCMSGAKVALWSGVPSRRVSGNTCAGGGSMYK
jgi:hypothetical protein